MPLPFSFLLDKSLTIQRNAPTKDSTGADVPSWSTVASGVKARLWPKKYNTDVDDFARPDGAAEFEWAFASDWGARPNDRFVDSGFYYFVVGVAADFSNDGLAAGPYVVKTIRRATA